MNTDLNQENLIEKSKTLLWAKFRDWNVGELRLLESYLSKIDPRRPESSTVIFTLADYGKLIGVSDLRHSQIETYTEHFLGNVVTMRSGTRNEWRKYTLFTYAECFYDDAEKQYFIKIKCNDDIKDVFFSIAKDGYTKYRLKNTIRMTKKYSILLYGMLLDMMHIEGGWQIDIQKLREQLGATDPSYIDFKSFRRRVLDPAITEINEISDIQTSYEKVIRGRKCIGIRFISSYKEKPVSALEPSLSHKPDKSDFAAALSDLPESSAIKIGEMVERKLKDLHPDVSDSHQATVDILKAAQKALLDDRPDYPSNPAGYVWSVLQRGATIEEYLPAKYLF